MDGSTPTSRIFEKTKNYAFKNPLHRVDSREIEFPLLFFFYVFKHIFKLTYQILW